MRAGILRNGKQKSTTMNGSLDPGEDLSDDDDAVMSGSATGFSDGEDGEPPELPKTKPPTKLFDPVNAILDKIDAELSTLNRSQSSTATDSTIVRRSSSRGSEHTEDLSISHLRDSGSGRRSPVRNGFSPGSSGSYRNGGSDKDTGIGTGSFHGDSFHSTESTRRGTKSPTLNQNGVILSRSDDDKANKGETTLPKVSSVEASEVDEKFQEILRKRKGGYLESMKPRESNDETDTIRTEDFSERFQDTMVLSSDESDGERNLGGGGHVLSDWDSDQTDVLAQKLIALKGKGRQSSDTTRKITPPSEQKRFKKGMPGTPPIYPKSSTDTIVLRRPAQRLPFRLGSQGHTSDADSIRTEDFESRFNEIMVPQTGESDADGTGTSDPIHTRVKQLLKATEKYRPKPEQKKQHVRISSSPPQYQKSPRTATPDDSDDDTLCSDKEEDTTSKPRQAHRKPDDVTDSVDEARHEIARESARIRLEMDHERRSKSASPVRSRDSRSPTRTMLSLAPASCKLPNGTEYESKPVTHATSSSRKSLSDEEKERSAELQTTQDALQVTQRALQEAEKKLKETRSQAEDARTQLMLSEFKKENIQKDLDRITEDLNKKRKQIKSLENQFKAKIQEAKEQAGFGFTKEEAVEIIEANESMKSKLRNMDAMQLERDELIRQLETAKQELFHEQKQARVKIEELQEELENVSSQCEQMQTEKEENVRKLQRLEKSFKKMDREKNEIIQERTRLYEEEKNFSKKNQSESQKRTSHEMEEMRQELISMNQQISELQDELQRREELSLQLRDQVIEYQQQLTQEQRSRDDILEEHKKTLQSLRKDTDTAMVQLRESLFLEKQKAIEALREEAETERRTVNLRAEEKFSHKIAEHAHIAKAKMEEIHKLQKLIDKLETEKKAHDNRTQEEIKIQVREAVNRERQVQEAERESALRQERENLNLEYRHKLKQIGDQLDRERQERETAEDKLKEVKDELDDVRAQSKQNVHEKLVAVARAKELMRQEHQSDIDRVREQLKKEHLKEVEKLQETIRIQAEEIRELRSERQKWQRNERDSVQALDRTERTLVNEINEECRRTSSLLGLSPRKISLSSFRSDSPTLNGPSSSRTKTPTTAALANLRACNEELRSNVQELRQDIEVLRAAITRADQNKDDALQDLKRRLEREKHEEMERLKERLVRGMSTNEYHSFLYTPDNDIASLRQSQQYKQQQEFRLMSDGQQREIERLEREIKKLAMKSAQRRVAQDKSECENVTSENMSNESNTSEYIKSENKSSENTTPNQSILSQKENEVVRKRVSTVERGRTFLNQSQMRDKSAPPSDDYMKALQQLQSKVKQLQAENNSLRRAKLSSSSVPDLSNTNLYNTPPHRRAKLSSHSPNHQQNKSGIPPTPPFSQFLSRTPTPSPDQEKMASVLGKRMVEVDMETDVAMEQQHRSRNVMSQKMAEMSKLQNHLTNQAKELIQLEKAYTQLNNLTKSASR